MGKIGRALRSLSGGRFNEEFTQRLERGLDKSLGRMSTRLTGNPRTTRRLLRLNKDGLVERMGADNEPIFDFNEHRREKRKEIKKRMNRAPSQVEEDRLDYKESYETEDPDTGLSPDWEEDVEAKQRQRTRQMREKTGEAGSSPKGSLETNSPEVGRTRGSRNESGISPEKIIGDSIKTSELGSKLEMGFSLGGMMKRDAEGASPLDTVGGEKMREGIYVPEDELAVIKKGRTK